MVVLLWCLCGLAPLPFIRADIVEAFETDPIRACQQVLLFLTLGPIIVLVCLTEAVVHHAHERRRCRVPCPDEGEDG